MSNGHQARIAPRPPWQAIDLGTRLYRQWWRPLTLIWLLTTLPVAALLWAWAGPESLLAPLLFWWLKPLWERPLLEYCARALFGEHTPVLTLLRQFPRYGLSYLFDQLTWRRLSPSRSYFAPVFQLEKGDRKQIRTRLRALQLPPTSHSGTLTLLVLHLEQGLMISLMMLAWVLVPWEVHLDLQYWLADHIGQYGRALLVCWYLAMVLMEPLYVCCGFALYLNKRTWLEGWDLEPGLRRIGAQRRPGVTALLLAALLLPAFAPPPAQADTAAPAREQAIEIIADDDFMSMRLEQGWRQRDEYRNDLLDRAIRWLLDQDFDGNERPRNDLSLGWLNDLLRIIAWGALIAVLCWLLWSQRHRLGLPVTDPAPRRTAPTVRGMSIARDSLPDDPEQAIRAALAAGDIRLALSLLYRITLSELHQRHGLRIALGATEGEVLRQLQQRQPSDPLTGFLGRLTPVWVALAWGHRPAAPEQVSQLLDDWRASLATESTA
ncbi:hypothetical protein S7S_06050 [Isoalcanivorax pacificus W11-5]|uniref:Protein-glutamine gamma-glutamyltransferase-like C-terminal domain-containing protein n=1 Tax=Isoalcanivorax pacificus W11-5 TaxID=391936 RepID=A0A0B4XKK2_9GAMM|nr:DUF4129 domain-containing protein [Isoalcanivorax pacificus]AJD47626.1 hypothetical protein S7S_06050 [Isoalcanivorax pacificus W11-5]